MLPVILFFSLIIYSVNCGNYIETFSGLLEQTERIQDTSENCSKQLRSYKEDLANKQPWALRMFDATAKIQSGILSGNTINYGNIDQCLSITHNGTIKGKYCKGMSGNLEEFKIDDDFVKERTEMLTWGICIPHACNTSTANALMTGFLREVLSENLTARFREYYCQVKEDSMPNLSTGALVTLFILLLLVVFTVMSTLYDVYLQVYGKKPIHPIFIIFSAYSNGRKLFSINNKSSGHLTCLNGIRCLSMVWVVIRHAYAEVNMQSVFNYTDLIVWQNSWYSAYISGAPYVVDTFFLLGGLVMTYSFLRARDKKVPFSIGKYYLHRYIRLAPVLAIIVLIDANLMEYMGSGPNYPFLMENSQRSCKEYWWSTMLFIQNYVKGNGMCVAQTWYLNVDMQLYILSPLLLFPLYRWPRCTLGVITIGILAGMGIPFYVAWVYELPGLPGLISFIGSPCIIFTYMCYLKRKPNAVTSNYYRTYYIVTHARFAPWLIGLILGYFVWKQKQTKNQLKLNKLLSLSLWILSLLIMLVCVFSKTLRQNDAEHKKWDNAIYIALMKSIWSVAVSWIIYACTFGHGGVVNYLLSFSVYQVLERLTYSVYLVHMMVILVTVYSRSVPLEFNFVEMMYKACGTLIFSAVLAVVLNLIAEYPAVELEKIIFKKD